MKKILLSVILAISAPLNAQIVQWGSKVIEFSSELTPVQYSARQVLGKPDILPTGGESSSAWTPERANRREYIKEILAGQRNTIPSIDYQIFRRKNA